MNNINSKIFDLAIVGGGASGMMACLAAVEPRRAVITSARLNQSVILIEKNAELGRKILATGNGRCNLTNKFIDANRYHGGDSEFIESVLKSFDQFETIKFFENLGLVLKEENLGRIFPRNDQAQSVVDALAHEIENCKIDVKLGDQVRKIEKNDNIFILTLASGDIIKSQKLIVTTGGQAAPHLGTTGDAYFWLKNFGHTITDLHPALAPIEIKEAWIKEVQGLKIETNVSTSIDGKIIYEKQGDCLFTHFGLSGPAAMAQAGAIGPNLGNAPTINVGAPTASVGVKIHLDLFPDIDTKNLDEKLAKIIKLSGAKNIKNVLAGIIPTNLAPILLTILNINPDRKSAEISKIDRTKIAETLKNIELTVSGVRPFKEAQVTHGGVNLDEIDIETLESKIVPGLYLAGEVLNVDGDSGGFNLQWAWSSGHLAGENCSN